MAETTLDTTTAEPLVLALDGLEGTMADLAAIEHRTTPTIGVVRDRCEGFGLAAATAVDLLVAAPTATFGRAGEWSPVVLRRGAGVMGRRAVGYLVMTGRRIDAATAHRWGLVSHLADDPDGVAGELQALVASRSPVAVRTILRQAHRGATADYAEVRAISDLP